MDRQNDNVLINRVLDGDIRNYALLIDRHKDLAFTLAYRLLNNREDAEEVVQDAFLKAYRSLSRFRGEAKFSTWLFRIVYNAAVSKKRLKKTGMQSLDEQPAMQDIFTGSSLEEDADEEKKLLLERALMQLSEEERALISLFYLNESSIDEIHGITGLTKSNIKVKLFRARKKLQEYVGCRIETPYV
jgi:RNA polymerase sigma-70 factor (ECF subfamily)